MSAPPGRSAHSAAVCPSARPPPCCPAWPPACLPAHPHASHPPQCLSPPADEPPLALGQWLESKGLVSWAPRGGLKIGPSNMGGGSSGEAQALACQLLRLWGCHIAPLRCFEAQMR